MPAKAQPRRVAVSVATMGETHARFTFHGTWLDRQARCACTWPGGRQRPDLVGRHHGENWIRTLAVNPDTATRFTQYFEQLFRQGGARLPLREQELIAVVVSAQNGCGLCEVHHTNALGDVLDDRTRARRIALDHHLAPLTERERALADFALKVTANPKDVGTADLERLRAVGLSDPDIVEALEKSAWFNQTNRIFISLCVIPDEKYFEN
jgi:uncharacterized peroxidase-related enzyme